MTIAHAPKGFTGTVDELDETRRFGLLAAPFRVASPTDWLVTADVGSTRQVLIAAGEGAAWGVADATTLQDALTFAANTGSTNRYDAVVASFDWGAHSATFKVITGGATPPAVNTSSSVDTTKINRVRKVRYDALLSIVRVQPAVSALTAGDVVDCRVWGGYEGYANCGSAQYLSLLDTYRGSLIRDITTDIVWNRQANDVWGFEKWVGSDRSKQPLISLRKLAASVAHDTTTAITAYPDVTDQSGGLLKVVSARYIQCNVPGRVRIEAAAISDMAVAGKSEFRVTSPAGAGNYQASLYDTGQRDTGYPGAGSMRQLVTSGPVQVQPGDQIDVSIYQYNTTSVSGTYSIYLTVTYV